MPYTKRYTDSSVKIRTFNVVSCCSIQRVEWFNFKLFLLTMIWWKLPWSVLYITLCYIYLPYL